ncbi:MAG: hypothetical protein OEZ39_02860 [Gammaproteobacteria bacterium]|nr:hypothetical protein [Gammaproteobacteria bacterium]MDH5650796.1 hypothetical protein [Gammaproteobacteria bacterium]
MKGKSFQLPKPLYESLPAIYILLGAGSIFLVSTRLAVTSGLMLILIGGLIIVQRRNYRSESQAINRHVRQNDES